MTNKYGESVSDTIQLTVLYLEEEQQTVTVTADPELPEIGDFNFDLLSSALGLGAGIVFKGIIIGIIALIKGGSKVGKKKQKLERRSKNMNNINL